MAENSSDLPGKGAARPALPPFRRPAAPAPAGPGAPTSPPGGLRPAAARPAFPPGGRATVPPFAPPGGAPRRTPPASSPTIARQSTPPAVPSSVPRQVTPPGDVAAAESAVSGHFGDLVAHRPTPSALPPALPTPPMPRPVVPAAPAGAPGDGAGRDENVAITDARGGADDPGDTRAVDTEAPDAAADAWSAAYEAEAAELLGDSVDEGAGAELSAYLADEGQDVSAAAPPADVDSTHPSLLPTPVIGVPTLAGTTWDASPPREEGIPEAGADALAYPVAPPDPVLADAMREADADAWSDPLADEPLGGGFEREAGAYGAATPYMVAAQPFGAGPAYGAPDADAVADAIERVAAWVRSGELPVSVPPAQDPTEAQALAAALAALLGLGTQR